MNYSTAVMLFNDEIRAVLVAYERDTEKTKAKRTMYKTLDKSIQEGDLVIVPTDDSHRHGFTISRVVEVDVDWDETDNTEVKWIAGRADTAAYLSIIEEEKSWIEAMKRAQKRARREEIKKNMVDAKDAGDLEGMKIVQLSDVKQLEGNAPAATQETGTE